jgi:hypothetical protein
VFARVGFDDVLPPIPQGAGPVPVFVDMDADGMPVVNGGGPDSPTLEVTQGYVRLHMLQGNSNDGIGGLRDPNGADIVLFELHQVPEPSSVALAILGVAGLALTGRRRRR